MTLPGESYNNNKNKYLEFLLFLSGFVLVNLLK